MRRPPLPSLRWVKRQSRERAAMRPALLALTLLASACATKHTGTPRSTTTSYDLPVVAHDFTPTPPTTVVVVPATTAPPVPVTVAEVVPLASSEPVPHTGIEQVIARAFERFGGGVVNEAIAVARCESNLNPRAYNPSGASGLFQVMPLWAEDYARVTGQPYYDGRYDAHANATFAAWLYGQSGTWRHWSCRGAA